MVGPIESVTVGVRDIDRAIAFFRDRLRLSVVADTRASVGLLAAWKRPVHESVRLVELAVPNRRLGRVRLAHFENGIETLTSERAGPHTIVLPTSDTNVTLEGPDGLSVELTDHHDAVVTVRAPDLAASARFYVDGLGWQEVPGRSSLTKLFSASPDSGSNVLVHRSLLQPGTDAGTRTPGHDGINLITCACDDMDRVVDSLAALGIEPVTRPAHVGLPIGRPGRVMLVHGPAGELFELTELAA